MANTYMKFGQFEGVLENTFCCVCEKDNPSRLILKNKEGVGFYKCRNCNLMYASPRFTEESMLKIYENEKFADLSDFDNWSYDRWSQTGNRSYNIQQMKIMLIKRYLSAGNRILDVGCGTGLFVLEANKNRFLCEGVEPSSRLSEIGQNILNVPISTMQIEEFNPLHKFSGVIIWDVLEHVYGPAGILKKCFELLEAGGFLFLQVPNHRGISNRYKTLLYRLKLKGTDYKHFGFPWHVYSYDRESLSVLLNKTGLNPVLFESWSHLLKDGKNSFIARTLSSFTKKLCLSDYIVCAAQKI